jgi:glycosyltransferase involved in cell wall biosynthesis
MEITVCVCTHDRPSHVRDCLAGLRRQSVGADRFEILLVDSASTAAIASALASLAAAFSVRLIRVERTGVSAARNAGARAARAPVIAYIDDDAVPAPDWIEAILRALPDDRPRPALLGGRILPDWEQPLPSWWPASLRGVLSIIEHEGQGTYRTAELPPGLEPYAANMVVDVAALLAVGGFDESLGRYGQVLLSDEEVRLAWAMQDTGHRIVYDSRIVVHHRIQAARLHPAWLLRRLYWQGASTVTTRRLTRRAGPVWREVPRRLAVLALLGPAAAVPMASTSLIGLRWRVAYALGFVRAAFGWRAARTAARRSAAPGSTRPAPRATSGVGA